MPLTPGDGPPVRIVRAAVAVALLLPSAVPVDQLTEVGRLLAVFDDELVLEELLGCGPLQGDTPMKKRLMGHSVHQGAPKGNYNYTSENLSCPILLLQHSPDDLGLTLDHLVSSKLIYNKSLLSPDLLTF